MIRLVFGIAIGYVLGARAGHARYEQIVRLSSKVSDNPAIQGVAGFVQAKLSDVLPNRAKREPRRPDLAYLMDSKKPRKSRDLPAQSKQQMADPEMLSRLSTAVPARLSSINV